MLPPARRHRIGFWRVYALVSALWVLAFSYVAITSHGLAWKWGGLADQWFEKAQATWFNPQSQAIEQTFKERTDSSYTALWNESVNEQYLAEVRRNWALFMLPVVPFGLPMIWFPAVWLSSRF